MTWFWVNSDEYQAIGRKLDTISTKLTALAEQGKNAMGQN